jgi:nucleoside 2-deoxyribosyltransferase
MMRDMREIMYLCGQISVAAPESFEWRARVRKYFANREDFEVIDPCLDDFNREMMEKSMEDRSKIYKVKGIKLIVPRDRLYVEKSTIGICNLNLYDESKPMIGTMYELAWYLESPEKAVIGIFDGDPTKDIYCNHPFVRRVVDVWTKDEREACEVLEYYFTKRRM